MRAWKKIIIPAVIACCFSTALAAAKTKAAPADGAKAIITKLTGDKAKVIQEFDAVGNLKGFVLTSKDGKAPRSIVYTDKDGKYLLIGSFAIVSPTGQNLSRQYEQKYITSVVAPKAYVDAAKTKWFLAGKNTAKHKAYMIVEPNCSACHLAYEQVKPMIDSGDLAIRFIMVSFLRPDSEAKAAAILDAKDPSAAFAKDEKGFDMKTESGGITPAKTVSAATKAKIKANMDFMMKHQFQATPVLIYKTNDGKYQTNAGFPRDPKASTDMINSMAATF